MNDYIKEKESKLTPDQNTVYNNVIDSVNTNSGKAFFLNAPVGTGKTFLINLSLAKIRSQNYIAIAVALSGIASTILSSGRIAHSTFKLPLDLTDDDETTCNITVNSPTGQLHWAASFFPMKMF